MSKSHQQKKNISKVTKLSKRITIIIVKTWLNILDIK